MLIPASALHRYIDDSSEVKVAYALPLRENWRVLNGHDVLVLAAALAIFGTGSPSKLKYCALTVRPEEAEAILDEHRAQKLLTIRGQLARSEASTTCVRSIVPAKRAGQVRAFINFRHVRTRYFLPVDREELQSTGVSFRPRYDPTCDARPAEAALEEPQQNVSLAARLAAIIAVQNGPA